MTPEVFKLCCPQCDHIFFRLEREDATCPECKQCKGMLVAKGSFQVIQTLADVIHDHFVVTMDGASFYSLAEDRMAYEISLRQRLKELEPRKARKSKR